MTAWLTLIVAVATLFAGSSPELIELFDAANSTDMNGRQLSVTFTEEGTVTDLRRVAQTGGMAMVESSGGATMVGNGVLYKDDLTAAAMPAAAPMEFSDRYDVTIEPTARGTEASIWEAGALRARYVFGDDGALAMSEVFAADGSLFRMQMLIPDGDEVPGFAMDEMPEPDMMVEASSGLLPAMPAYQAGPVYEAPAGGVQRFYTDGLFRFSVFAFPVRTSIVGMEIHETEYDGRDGYHRSYGPTTTSVTWHGADHTYVVVGDLPPDHLAAVIGELPRPASQNWFARMWRKLFG